MSEAQTRITHLAIPVLLPDAAPWERQQLARAGEPTKPPPAPLPGWGMSASLSTSFMTRNCPNLSTRELSQRCCPKCHRCP